jgi:hypothetical protein
MSQAPNATNDSYIGVGNTELRVGTGVPLHPAAVVSGSVLANDTDADNGPSPLTATFSPVSANGGTVTGNANGTGRTPFPNNQIPGNLIDPIALKVLNLFPMPNNAGTGTGGLTNNYRRQEDRTVDRKNYDMKVNFNRTTAHQLWAKYSYMNAVVDDLTNYLGPDPNAEGDGGNTKVYALSAGQTWTLRPTLLLDYR